jgi:glyceraldehyde 3-phosphate dehydrogenase
MHKVKIAINGFGRIGRGAFKLALEKEHIEVVAINDLSDPSVLAHLLKYDSVFGLYNKEITADIKHEKVNPTCYTSGTLIVENKKFPIFAEKDPALLPWKDLDIDVVLECTGRFTDSEKAGAHIKAGAKKVIISAPAKDEGATKTYMMGVNIDKYSGEQIISNASCTTNNVAPVTVILHENFGIEKMMMSTIHAYTAEQNLIDGPPPALHKDLRRARAAAVNVVPTSTGASVAVVQVIPELAGSFGGIAFRVPVPCGSLSDFTAVLKKNVTREEVNEAFTKAASDKRWKDVLMVTNDPIVSSDIVGNPYSSIVDLSLTQVVAGNLVKVVSWYDNEFGYSNRLVEEAIMIGQNK